jgi:hypothetical protein
MSTGAMTRARPASRLQEIPMTATQLAPRTDPTVPAPDPAPLALDPLVENPQGIAAAPLWAPHANHDHDRRPVRLLATPTYEVWVLGWVAGQSVELHDHGDAAGAIVVTEGTLTEIVSPGPIDEANRLTLPAGAVRAIPTGLVHDVLNLHPEPATSIHVYSPPLTAMTFYDPVDGHAVRTEAVDAEAPALDPSAASSALHPSRLAGR